MCFPCVDNKVVGGHVCFMLGLTLCCGAIAVLGIAVERLFISVQFSVSPSPWWLVRYWFIRGRGWVEQRCLLVSVPCFGRPCSCSAGCLACLAFCLGSLCVPLTRDIIRVLRAANVGNGNS